MPPSSVWIQWSSTRPWPSRLRFWVLAPSGSSLTCWVEMLCSQVCRSAPVSVSTRAVRPVHQRGTGFGGALLAERIAVMPDGAGVGAGFRGGNCGHTSTLRARGG